MTIEQACEKFVAWLERRMTLAGRGDEITSSEYEPAGRFWLGRLQPCEEVSASDMGDRGERLEPCSVGLKIRPRTIGELSLRVQTSFKVWQWDKESKLWSKSSPIFVDGRIQLGPDSVSGSHMENELSNAIFDVTGEEGRSARIDIDIIKDPLELTITLVNTSPLKEDRQRKDLRFYEVELKVSRIDIDPFILESLEDSFRYDRHVDAYGVNCGVQIQGDWLVTEDAITVDTKRPQYWNSDHPEPNLKFTDLSTDPVGPATQLLEALRSWGDLNWSEKALDDRALEEKWSPSMLQSAKTAALEFFEECNRIQTGIELLKTNSALAKAFHGMNLAMSYAANGRYGSWRPFQFGFLLANLNSLIEVDKESRTVDVVWFATGGGKTETYLGLLVTAVLLDRMNGKYSGITAWSRFPLRMLSLQQTQRFANALAGAERVRQELNLGGDPISLGFFVGQDATPNQIKVDVTPGSNDPDPDDPSMPDRYKILDYCPFCFGPEIKMTFDRLYWRLNHVCANSNCSQFENALPVYVVDDEIYRFLPTVLVGTLDKAASISLQASMRGFVGAPWGVCSKTGHGYVYAPRSKRPNGCLVPGCKGTRLELSQNPELFAPSFRLQDELHLLRDSLGAVDSHYESLFDGLQKRLTGRSAKILASSATLTGYKKQVDVLYSRDARVFPVPPPKTGRGFWTAESTSLMRKFVAIAPRGVTIEYTVDRLLTELQLAVRALYESPVETCRQIGVDESLANELLSIFGTDVVYGNTIRDLEAVMRSMPTQVLANGPVNTDTLTGRTEFKGVREALNRLQSPEPNFLDRLHIISASSMMSHGVDVDRLNVMVMLGIPLSAAEFIQATARVGRKYPAIVFVVHKIGRERDAGVYRSFKQFVRQGDRFVEPVPVTRRSRQVLKRTIAGLEMARVLMIHEPQAQRSIATLQAFKQYIRDTRIDIGEDRDAILELLKLDSDLDAPLKKDLDTWFEQFQQNIEIPPNEAKFPSDLSPTSRPMMSLRDVERQVPVIGSQI